MARSKDGFGMISWDDHHWWPWIAIVIGALSWAFMEEFMIADEDTFGWLFTIPCLIILFGTYKWVLTLGTMAMGLFTAACLHNSLIALINSNQIPGMSYFMGPFIITYGFWVLAVILPGAAWYATVRCWEG